MIDLSFLTDAEQEAILKVLQRDAELKKAEEQRVRHLQDEVNDENELKYKSGQWFYDAKSKRHRDKIHGADLVRASIRKRKNPTTLAELSQSGKDKSKRRWVNSINQDLFIPPELYGVMESPDETEEDLKLSMAETNQSAKRLNVASKDTDKGVMKNGTASPAKQRKNPFNSEGSVDEIDLSNGMPDQSLGGDQVNGQVGKKSGTEPLYAVVKKPTSSDQEKDKKPDTSELSNSKKGMEESNPVLSALKRSTDKKLVYAKAVEEVSPSSTNQSKPNSQKGDTLGPIENSFPENAEKFKRMSQSVPTFLQDDTDGRDTDSASESSFQIGRHKKSPSSLTNLSGSSGMASMSSVSGSVMSMYSGDFGNVDIKGGIEFSIDYVEQLKEFHIYIYQCKDLAAAEVKKQRSDPYVKAYLLPEKAKMGKRKSAVKKKTLNPVYNEILRYKIPKESLETQTLNLSVWHHDVLGRNSFLGEVNLNLATWDWNNTQRNWYQLEARTPASGIGLENRGEMKLSLMYIPMSPPEVSKKPTKTGEVHIMIRECIQLPMLRENKINSFVKCTILPDTSRKSRQKTRTVDKTPNPIFNHTMVYDGFKEEDLREACVELTVWDHNKLSNHFLGGIRIGLGTGKSYGTAVDWMDSSPEESTMWEKMIASPNTWIEGMLPLRMFKMAKLNK
ncbi:synaptotagmin-like protein 2 isoform X16 [Hyla sarda]|uniref:synaptotagmin-like protein 2 isoform X16 n=1 Tax=Hyla sarda TaxID=327740 RepID=UPI0024C435D1|nr:synaptotagmin-like protein 2 isoform X16 [Hyla sarda]